MSCHGHGSEDVEGGETWPLGKQPSSCLLLSLTNLLPGAYVRVNPRPDHSLVTKGPLAGSPPQAQTAAWTWRLLCCSVFRSPSRQRPRKPHAHFVSLCGSQLTFTMCETLGVPMKWGSWEHITCKHGEEKGAGLCVKTSG